MIIQSQDGVTYRFDLKNGRALVRLTQYGLKITYDSNEVITKYIIKETKKNKLVMNK